MLIFKFYFQGFCVISELFVCIYTGCDLWTNQRGGGCLEMQTIFGLGHSRVSFEQKHCVFISYCHLRTDFLKALHGLREPGSRIRERLTEFNFEFIVVCVVMLKFLLADVLRNKLQFWYFSSSVCGMCDQKGGKSPPTNCTLYIYVC